MDITVTADDSLPALAALARETLNAARVKHDDATGIPFGGAR